MRILINELKDKRWGRYTIQYTKRECSTTTKILLVLLYLMVPISVYCLHEIAGEVKFMVIITAALLYAVYFQIKYIELNDKHNELEEYTKDLAEKLEKNHLL